MKRIIVLAAVALASSAFAASYELDPAHSQANFSVKHMKFATVRGEFKKLKGKFDIDDKDPSKSSVVAAAEASSIDTNEPKRDAHLKSADFFDADKCPEVAFKSTKVAKAGKEKLKVTGDLTMHCITKPVTFDVEGPSAEMKGPFGNTMRAFVATATINRKDWGLNWNKALEAGGMLVSDEVKLELTGELVPVMNAPETKDTAKEESKKEEPKKDAAPAPKK